MEGSETQHFRLPRTGRRTEDPELSALTAPDPHLSVDGTAHPAADIAPGCGAGRAEGPSQAPRPAGVSGPGCPARPPARRRRV
ncbi:hypothetical protein B6E66_29465 [Streptomyces maremycinicus]|nr:hypothetical protein B6E66_29465 [Streptomyces sp. B9173]